jgi:hypothetical protein
MLSKVYPEYEWLPWKFRNNSNHWGNIENQRKCMDWIAVQLEIKEFKDWYKIKAEVVKWPK